MRKKTLILTLLLGLCGGASAFAQSVSEMTISTKTGSASYSISDVKSMTLEGNSLKVNRLNSTAADVYQFDDINQITFNLTTGIAEMKLAGTQLSIYSPANSNLIYVKGYEQSQQYEVSVYGLSGNMVLRKSEWKGEPVDVSGLQSGIYIFKINNSTFKFRK